MLAGTTAHYLTREVRVLRRDGHSTRPRERLRQPREHGEVGVKRDPLKTANVERGESEPMLQRPELSFDCGAAPVQIMPPLRITRDERLRKSLLVKGLAFRLAKRDNRRGDAQLPASHS